MVEISDQNSLLGDYEFQPFLFPNLDVFFEEFQSENFVRLSARKRFVRVNRTLLQLLQEAPKQSFLLPAVIHFISSVNQHKILDETFQFILFEFWLNNFSQISEQEQMEIRSKIAGKRIPRDAYQAYFPIGMGQKFYGTHFVAGHLSPDVDTTIGSFFGWLDAFAARVGTSQHIWSLPGGPPESPVITVFKNLFGQTVFSILSRISGTLTLTAMDVVSQQNVSRHPAESLISALKEGYQQSAVILVDSSGHYLDDWRTSDLEPVQQVNNLYKTCLRWFQNHFHTKLITLFGQEGLTLYDLHPFLNEVFGLAFKDFDPVQEFTSHQLTQLDTFLKEIFHLSEGYTQTIAEFIEVSDTIGLHELKAFYENVKSFEQSDLFDSKGNLKENRPLIFGTIEKLIRQLDHAIYLMRNYTDRLDVVIQIKQKVLKQPQHFVTLRTGIDDIRLKMENYDYLTVVIPEGQKYHPVGVIWAHELRKSVLGTVTFRDFCNFEEINMASYLSVISVIDHHKSFLKTLEPPMALIGDVQSCNVLIAEQTFIINDRYRARANSNYYIHPDREYCESLCFIHAILDDTDLLTKVSSRDVECVANLLNHMKSLLSKKETRIINLDEIPKDDDYIRCAAQKILQLPDMYSLYKKIYSTREHEVESQLNLCINDQPSNIFQDTKEQNGCARVGQTKMFASNFPLLLSHAEKIRTHWVKISQKFNELKPEIDLYLHMISTITSADEVYHGQTGEYAHQDELWLWVPETTLAYEHLYSFLNAFQGSPDVQAAEMELDVAGRDTQELEKIFKSTLELSPKKIQKDISFAILRFRAGTLNSRKAMVTPYLPRLIP